jgi:Holliday junction resolvase RusA-like endonuclease
MVLCLTVPGTPVGQGSMTLRTNGGTYYPTTTINHRNLVVGYLERAWAGAPPLECAVALRCRFVHPRPADHYLPANSKRAARELRADAPRWHTAKRDNDKQVRLVGDALPIAGVIEDDGQIALIRSEKVWGETGYSELEVWIL